MVTAEDGDIFRGRIIEMINKNPKTQVVHVVSVVLYQVRIWRLNLKCQRILMFHLEINCFKSGSWTL